MSASDRDPRVLVVEDDEHIRDLAVLGFIEVVRHIPKHWQMLRDIRARIRSGQVALVVLVDYPGFNMRVAEAAADGEVDDDASGSDTDG